MFELEKAIASWRKQMEADPALEPGHIAEIESHLRDKIDDLTARGRIPEEAFEEAVRALGETGLIGSQFFKVYTPRRSGRPSWPQPRRCWSSSWRRSVSGHSARPWLIRSTACATSKAWAYSCR